MTSAEPVQVVNNYLNALEERDFERLRSYLSDSFSYQGQTGQFDDADSFMQVIWPAGQILHHIEHRKTFVDGSNVCSVMNFHVHFDKPRCVPVVQWTVVEEGKIVSIEVFFDATEYTAMFAE